jgi:purine nucleoside phosphorylase
MGRVGGRPVVFLARHGDEHTLAPHQRELSGEPLGIAECAATAIVAVAAVGGIRSDLRPGDLVIPHQIIDYTWGRHSTYHEGPDSVVTHVDFTEPYDPQLRRQIGDAAAALGMRSAMPRSTPQRRDHAWKPPPRSTGSNAMAPTSSA